MAGQSEKRGYLRIPVELAADFQKLEEKDLAVPKIATAMDISCGGLFIESLLTFEVGDYLSVDLELPDNDQKISFVGAVRWCKEENRNSENIAIPAGIGVQIVKISEDDEIRLNHYLDRLDARVVSEAS